jgi:Domain of unknown function (DUF4160)
VPTVAIIDGIKIRFYNDEHPPPHFHAKFAEYEVVINIGTLRAARGFLPPAKLRRVLDWARPRKQELLAAWFACQADDRPGRLP